MISTASEFSSAEIRMGQMGWAKVIKSLVSHELCNRP